MITYELYYTPLQHDPIIKSRKVLTLKELLDKIGEEHGEDVKGRFVDSGGLKVQISTLENPDSKFSLGDLLPGGDDMTEVFLTATKDKDSGGDGVVIKIVEKDLDNRSAREIMVPVSNIDTVGLVGVSLQSESDEKSTSEELTLKVGSTNTDLSDSTLELVTKAKKQHSFFVPNTKVYRKESDSYVEIKLEDIF